MCSSHERAVRRVVGRFLGMLIAGLLVGPGTGCESTGPGGPDAAPLPDAAVDAGPDAGSDAAPGEDARFARFAEALQADLASSGAKGISAAVMEDGVVTFAEAFGSRDVDGLEPMTPTTLMIIGSTTKQLTATLLLQQVEEGMVSLDATLEEALPLLEFARDPSWDDRITLRHLLTHQTGLQDGVAGLEDATDALFASYVYESWSSDAELMAPPGTFFNYCNAGFMLAGLLSEELGDQPWPDLLRQKVLLPLGMTRTFARRAEAEADGDYFKGGATDVSWIRPAGLVWSTPTELMTWARFLMDGDPAVLSAGMRAELTTPQVDTRYPRENNYGFGLWLDPGYLALDGTWYPMRVWNHPGFAGRFTFQFYVFPEQRFAFAISASKAYADLSHSVDAAITTLMDLPEPAAVPEDPIDPASFGRHVGRYVDPLGDHDMVVTLQDATLLVEMPELSESGADVQPELVPITSDIFWLVVNGTALGITFIPLVEGGPSQWVRQTAFVSTRVE